MTPTAALFWIFYGLLGLAPFPCLFFLLRNFRRGTELPPYGAWGFYLGCPVWTPLIAAFAAIQGWGHGLVGAPFFIGAALGAAWQSRSAPRPGGLSIASNAAVFVILGLLAFVALGGGYFDRVFQGAHAQWALRKAGVTGDDPAALAAALRSPDRAVRWGAALALGGLGKGAAPALDALLSALEDEDERVGRSAFSALKRMGPAAAPGAPGLARLLGSEKHSWDAERMFEELGPAASSAVPELVLLIDDPSPGTRRRAVAALCAIGPSAKEAALPALARRAKIETDAAVKDAIGGAGRKLGYDFAEWTRAGNP